MPTYKEQQILDKVCKVTRQKQIKYYDFIPFFDFQYEKNIFNCQPFHFSPCSAVHVKRKTTCKKGQIFDQNYGVNTLEKRKFCDYVKMIFYTLKSVLFYLEHNRPI